MGVKQKWLRGDTTNTSNLHMEGRRQAVILVAASSGMKVQPLRVRVKQKRLRREATKTANLHMDSTNGGGQLIN